MTGEKWGSLSMALLTFADASFFIAPTSTVFTILSFNNRSKTLQYILYSVLGTLAGAIAGYAIGYSSVNTTDLQFFQKFSSLWGHIPGLNGESFLKVQTLYSQYGIWILLLSSATPLPFSLFSIFSGITGVDFPLFLILTLSGQTVRYTILAFLSGMGCELNLLRKKILEPVFIGKD